MTIKRLENGWYNFEQIPQGHRYIKISNLYCLTDKKAINQARKIIGDKEALIEIV